MVGVRFVRFFYNGMRRTSIRERIGAGMGKIRMIFNPQADWGRSYQVAGDMRHPANEWGGADWVGTNYPGHACALATAAAAAEAGYETIVALGGMAPCMRWSTGL
jgi:hypothetical protein